MPQFENEHLYSQDTFGLPQDHPTPLSNTYTFNPGPHPPPSPLVLSPFTPRHRMSRWDEEIKLFDPNQLSPLQENLEIELEMLQKEGKLAEEGKVELPFIIQPIPKKKKKSTRKSVVPKRANKKLSKPKQRQTNLQNYIFKRKSISK